jgi:N-acetylglucosamine kinase-like BadF-type ATPase
VSEPGPSPAADRDSLPLVLAIDGGNSKTDAVLVAADGSVLATARGPGLPGMLRPDETMRALGSVVTGAARRAGLLTGAAPAGPGTVAGEPGAAAGGSSAAAPDATGPRVARHLTACVANADLPEEEERLGALLRSEGWTDTAEVANDSFAVLRAGLPDDRPHWGVAVVCGAGINCVGVAPDGRTVRFLALGPLTGDWGGGDGLGQEVIWWAMRAEDGRGPQTALAAAVAAHYREQSVRDVAVGMHLGKIPEDSLLGLVPVLFAAAAAGDAVATDLVTRQADEITVMAVTAIRRLGLTGYPVPVVLGGGVVTARDPLLTALITERMAAAARHADLRIVDVPPVIGAALLGLDQLGAPVTAHHRLRAAYPHGGATPGPPDGATPGPPDGATPGPPDGATPGPPDGATPGLPDGATPPPTARGHSRPSGRGHSRPAGQ